MSDDQCKVAGVVHDLHLYSRPKLQIQPPALALVRARNHYSLPVYFVFIFFQKHFLGRPAAGIVETFPHDV